MIDVKIKTPKGFKIFRNKKYRTVYCYHRASGIKVNLDKYPLGSAMFYAECERIAKQQDAQAPKPGTLGLLMQEYEKGRHFKSLSERTQKDYRFMMKWLDERGSKVPLHSLSQPAVTKIRDNAAEWRSWDFGNRVHTFLGTLFQWGIEHGFMATKFNPAREIKKIKRPKDLPLKNPPLTKQELTALLAHASKEVREFIIVALFSGTRPSDTIKLLKSDYDGRYITCKSSSKTGEYTSNPVVGYAKEIVDGINHDAITLLASSLGTPWSYEGIATVYARLRDDLAEKGLVRKNITIYSLRHTISTLLAEEGVTEEIRAKICGHTVEQQRHYSKNARKQKLIDAALETLENITKPCQTLSNFRTGFVKQQNKGSE